MKFRKIFTLIFAFMTGIAGYATDYNVPVTVIVNDEYSEQSAIVSVVEKDGKYNLMLKNFVLQNEGGSIGVGNVELTSIVPYQDGNATLLLTKQTATITDGDDPEVSFWMGPKLSPVTVDLRAKIEYDHLRCYIDIDMMETLGQMIHVAVGEGFQLPNQSFEQWHSSSKNYEEPNAWHSFESATGNLAALAGHHLEKSTDAHSGKTSARIYATSIYGIVANGTMTTGRMNAGSMSAANISNHAYLDMSMEDKDGNGDPFYTPLYSRPDSIAVWVKFKQGTSNSSHPYATMSAVITDGTRYQDPENKKYTNVMAKAKNSTIAVTDDKWVRVTAPFNYTDYNVEPKAVLVTLSTNADAGQGSANDEMLIDDIEFIYNAEVTRLKVKNQEIIDFNANKTEYDVELNEAVTANDIEVAVNGRGAHIVKTVTTENDQYICTVQVISADMSTSASYKISVVSSEPTGIKNVNEEPGTKNREYYNLNGQRVGELRRGIYVVNGKKTVIK